MRRALRFVLYLIWIILACCTNPVDGQQPRKALIALWKGSEIRSTTYLWIDREHRLEGKAKQWGKLHLDDAPPILEICNHRCSVWGSIPLTDQLVVHPGKVYVLKLNWPDQSYQLRGGWCTPRYESSWDCPTEMGLLDPQS